MLSLTVSDKVEDCYLLSTVFFRGGGWGDISRLIIYLLFFYYYYYLFLSFCNLIPLLGIKTSSSFLQADIRLFVFKTFIISFIN